MFENHSVLAYFRALTRPQTFNPSRATNNLLCDVFLFTN